MKSVEEIEEEAERIATKDTLALVGFVLALIGFLSGLVPAVALPLDVAGAVFSILGLKSKHWGGFAKAGIALAVIGILWTLFLFGLSIVGTILKGAADARTS